MVGALVSESSGVVSSPGRDIVPCSWARHRNILLPASCYRNSDKLLPDGPLGSYADFTFLLELIQV